MGLRMKKGGDCLKKEGLEQFADLRGSLKEGVVFEKGLIPQ